MCSENWPGAAQPQAKCTRPMPRSVSARRRGRVYRLSRCCEREERESEPLGATRFFTCSGRTRQLLRSAHLIDIALKKLPDLVSWPGVAEEITLHLGAADRLQHVHLLLRFHAFGS